MHPEEKKNGCTGIPTPPNAPDCTTMRFSARPSGTGARLLLVSILYYEISKSLCTRKKKKKNFVDFPAGTRETIVGIMRLT